MHNRYYGTINYEDIEIRKYYYEAPSMSSNGINIFFNAQTNEVVNVECKDNIALQ